MSRFAVYVLPAPRLPVSLQTHSAGCVPGTEAAVQGQEQELVGSSLMKCFLTGHMALKVLELKIPCGN